MLFVSVVIILKFKKLNKMIEINDKFFKLKVGSNVFLEKLFVNFFVNVK